MLRTLLGLFLILHGLAHALPGMPTDAGDSSLLFWLGVDASATRAVGTLLWAIALVGFVAAGLGAWGVKGLRPNLAAVAGMAATASLALFLLYWQPFLWLAVLIDIAIIAVALRAGPPAGTVTHLLGGAPPPARVHH